MIFESAPTAAAFSLSYLPIARIAAICAVISFLVIGLFAISVSASMPPAVCDSPSASAALVAESTERGFASSTSVSACLRNGSAASQLAGRPDFS